ncbi:MAG: c-type cytochrome [Blastocatellia bacterium]
MLTRILTMVLLAGAVSLTVSTIPMPNISAAQGDKNARGRALFVEYCASCHGVDGKGGGPVAPALKAALPDLTRIPLDNGKFPFEHIKQVIAGEIGITPHGNREMPVWGGYFRRRSDQSVSTLNVYALTKYLESIQQK